MITHHCFVRLAPAHATDAGRAAALEAARPLAALPGLALRLGVPADDTAAKWDLAIAIDAPSLAALAAARATPAWQALDAHLAAHAIVVKAWNFAAA
ncbi:MAG: hypothetical protein JNK64_23685 [Myxococcales bacterium]|nr:hypothetical protein [Myxococcales bacterium]